MCPRVREWRQNREANCRDLSDGSAKEKDSHGLSAEPAGSEEESEKQNSENPKQMGRRDFPQAPLQLQQAPLLST
jgi:hypothetical protein